MLEFRFARMRAGRGVLGCSRHVLLRRFTAHLPPRAPEVLYRYDVGNRKLLDHSKLHTRYHLNSLRLVDHGNANSWSSRMRNQRMSRFREALGLFRDPVRILDVGGTEHFWASRGFLEQPNLSVTLVNIEYKVQPSNRIEALVGDATALPFEDNSFDIVFSNSVIEHLFEWGAQERMAQECVRVGRNHWVQTPNYWFPIEPHFLCPGWQWLPVQLRIALIQRIRVGQRGPVPDFAKASALVREIKLLSRSEVKQLFPSSNIVRESAFGLSKSWTAIGGDQFQGIHSF